MTRKDLKSRGCWREDGLSDEVLYIPWEDVEEYIDEIESKLNDSKKILDDISEDVY